MYQVADQHLYLPVVEINVHACFDSHLQLRARLDRGVKHYALGLDASVERLGQLANGSRLEPHPIGCRLHHNAVSGVNQKPQN